MSEDKEPTEFDKAIVLIHKIYKELEQNAIDEMMEKELKKEKDDE